MPDSIWPTLISGGAIVLGSLVGAVLSGYIATKTTRKNIDNQYKLQEANLMYQEKYKIKEFCTHANVVRLDICTAIFQSIRAIQNNNKVTYLFIIPISKDYHKAVASLSDKYTLKELSYIYQLYGIIEKVNHDIYNWKYSSKEGYEYILLGFNDILVKVFGENAEKLVNLNIDELSYEDLYKNELIKIGYYEVLKKLDELSLEENIKKENEERVLRKC